MIVVTGAAGFIGSMLALDLSRQDVELVLVDDFSVAKKATNHTSIACVQKVDRSVFEQWLEANGSKVELIYHLGARTNTTEMDKSLFDKLNLEYTKMVWGACVRNQIPFIYASSAATYGSGEHGFSDRHEVVQLLQPLNPYGDSKQEFDLWALAQTDTPPAWYGLKFFNVYGPHEYHKGRMASVIFHTFRKVKDTGGMQLFRSHNPRFKNGEQSRDFIYVKDVIKMCKWLASNTPASGLYNIGTGKARSFSDLANATFNAMHVTPNISYVDTPIDIREKYQYFTEADMSKLKSVGYPHETYSLEDGIKDYVVNYLNNL